MKKNYTFAITLPLSLLVTVDAEDEAEARTKALETALETPTNEWGDDFSTVDCDLVKSEPLPETPKVCPYCGSENIEWMGDDDCYNEYHWHCHECDCWFDEDVCEHEKYWHQISALLNGTSEETPKEIEYTLPSYEEEACGLSSLEIPYVDKVFQVEGDGTMWYHIYRDNEFNGEPIWRDMSLLSTKDLKGLLEYLFSEK